MLPSLPFGPLSLPTGPIFAMLAVVVALDVAGRFGRRCGRRRGIHPDDLWNTGLLAVASGLIVARLWNVFQFWPIYRAEPLLVFSLRASGFEFWPGLVAAFVAAYAYLIWRALPPGAVGAALAVGLSAGGVLLEVSGHLTGSTLGLPTAMPWGFNYFGAVLHPVGLYRAVGLIVLVPVVWVASDDRRPGRTILLALFGIGLIRLLADGFLAQAALVGPFRASQVIALAVALIAGAFLARQSPPPAQVAAPSTAAPSPPPEDTPRVVGGSQLELTHD